VVSTNNQINILADSESHKILLRNSVAAISKQTGFEYVQSGALELLTHMLSNFLNELCCTSRDICEHSGRSIITLGDAHVGLINMGLKMIEFYDYLKSYPSSTKIFVQEFRPITTSKSTSIFHVNEPQPHPSHFPSFLPPFPDPHTYIRTEISDEVDSNYMKVRCLQAKNRRAMENNLVNYASIIYSTTSLFQELEKHEDTDFKTKNAPMILLPFKEDQSYLSGLVTEDVDVEEDQNYFAHILRKEMEDLADTDDVGNTILEGEKDTY